MNDPDVANLKLLRALKNIKPRENACGSRLTANCNRANNSDFDEQQTARFEILSSSTTSVNSVESDEREMKRHNIKTIKKISSAPTRKENESTAPLVHKQNSIRAHPLLASHKEDHTTLLKSFKTVGIHKNKNELPEKDQDEEDEDEGEENSEHFPHSHSLHPNNANNNNNKWKPAYKEKCREYETNFGDKNRSKKVQMESNSESNYRQDNHCSSDAIKKKLIKFVKEERIRHFIDIIISCMN